MTNPTNPDTPISSELVGRLQARSSFMPGGYANPDGPAAASLILSQEEIIKELVEAGDRLLKHAGIADADPEDIDGEDHIAESAARRALDKARSVLSRNGGGNEG